VIAALALALALFADPAPADGVRLSPDPAPVPAPAPAPAPAPVDEGAPAAPRVPFFPAAAGGATACVVALAAGSRARRRHAGLETGAPAAEEPLVVFVSGHGTDSAPGQFAHLVALMGLDPSQVRYFDYRWATGGTDHAGASEDASIDEAADALDGYLAGLSDGSGRPLYLVGFSKGGAGVAELVARWDRGTPDASHGVVGAALLEPPMASGVHGWLQSVGTFWGPLPDDGGYDPIECGFWSCVDTRDHLGEASGVEVVVVRNPQAGITSFADIPEDMRVYDASDGGPGFFPTLLTHPWDLVSRMEDAHLAVLDDPRVAECITAEAFGSGSCPLPQAGHAPAPGVIVHGPGNALKLVVNRMV